MRVWISIDMEGISNIVDRDQLRPEAGRYPLGRESMMADLQAVLSALQEQPDVDRITVNDSHNGMINILGEKMPDGVQLISGGAKAWSMNEGVQEADLAFYVGYHAMAGTQAAIMDHTYSGEIHSVTLNGKAVGETGINAALAGHYNVPVAFISGDDKVVDEAARIMPNIEGVVVKYGVSRRAAQLLPRAEVDRRLKAGVVQALDKYRTKLLSPWKLGEPIALTVGLMTPEMADRAMYCPGMTRLDGRTVAYQAANMLEAFRAFYVAMALSDRPLY